MEYLYQVEESLSSLQNPKLNPGETRTLRSGAILLQAAEPLAKTDDKFSLCSSKSDGARRISLHGGGLVAVLASLAAVGTDTGILQRKSSSNGERISVLL